jgi:YidC/Oxa1 family membrane protein insertase
MNIRNIYFALIVALSLGLLYEWSSDQRSQSVEDHLLDSSFPSFEIGEDYVAIENQQLYVVIAVKTGAIVETRLKEYKVENVAGSLGFRVFGESKESAFSYYFKSGFTGVSPSYQISELGSDYVELVDPLIGVSKRVSFKDAEYEISVYDSSLEGEEGKSFAGLYRTSGRALDLKRDALSGGMMNNSSYEGVAISSDGDPYSTSRLRGVEEPVEVLSRSGWVAFIQKYFFAAILGSDEYIYNYYVLPKESGLFRMGYTVEGSSGSNFTYDHEHRLFVGPKIRKDLMGRADNLELSIDMGWFWFLSQPMVWFMDVLNGYINNWGITIIVFTILIKLLFWPVTAKSFRSMANLRKITPELNEIKERYKDDRQKQGTETMKLMKKNGANPLGGCLPLLIQMPFFIGFFFALREMVELRHSELALWSDLSSPDPYFIMPALFALLMFLTQRLNPQPAGMDPTQAQVMKYMPLMFSVMFVFFPAALCIYTVVNTGVQLAQQSYLYKQQGALGSS